MTKDRKPLRASQPHSLDLCFGPLAFSLRTAGPFPRAFARCLRPFIGRGEHPYRIAVRFVHGRAPRVRGNLRLETRAGLLHIVRTDFSCVLDPVLRCGAVVIARNYLSLNSLLRALASACAVRANALLLHASGLILHGRAHVFVGRSGAGKSTIIRNNPRAPNLGDEIVGIVKRGRGYSAFTTPFGGELATPRRRLSAPLAGLHLIKKNPRLSCMAAPPAQAFPALLRCTMNFSRDPACIRRLTNLVADLSIRGRPCVLRTTVALSGLKIYNEWRNLS